MEEESRQLIRALRGSRSQRKLSQLLGYRGNAVEQWEAGRSFPTAAVTFRVCRIAGIDPEEAVLRFLSSFIPTLPKRLEPLDRAGVAEWMRHVRGALRIAELARRMDRPASMVGRWLRGSAEPKLPDLLRFVDAATGCTPEFVAALIPIESVPALLDEHNRRQRMRDTARSYPQLSVYRLALRTEYYQELESHEEGWLGRLFDLSPEQEREAFEQLVAAGIVEWRDGKYVGRAAPVGLVEMSPEDLKVKQRHWLSCVTDRCADPLQDDIFAFLAMSLSVDDRQAARRILVDALREIRMLANASTPEQRVALLNVQWIDWPDGKG